MNVVKKRLFCLNLALVMALLFVLPMTASAGSIGFQDEFKFQGTLTNPSNITKLPVTRTDSMRSYSNGGNAVQMAETGAYTIYVNDTAVSSDSDASGTGWTYTAATNTLALKDYDGCEIFSEGDLTITSSGTVKVNPIYLNDGIYAAGDLTIYVADGELEVNGATHATNPTAAVSAYGSISCFSMETAKTYFFGGDTNGSEVFGGDAMCSYTGDVYLYGANITAIGGASENYYGGIGIYAANATVVYASNCTVVAGSGSADYGYIYGIIASSVLVTGDNLLVAGSPAVGASFLGLYGDGCQIYGGSYGVYADSVSIYGDTEITGYIGIYYTTSCYIGPSHTTISGDYAAFYWDASTTPDPTYNEHVICSGDAQSYTFTPNQYTLLLYDTVGAASTSLRADYPMSYQLGEYIFRHENYVQIAWEDDSTLYPLNTVFLPQSDYKLSTCWLPVKPGDIVLNGLSGTFSDGNYYQQYSNTNVTLPSSLAYTNDPTYLMAWCTEVVSTPDTLTQIYGGQWYALGDTVAPNSSGTSVYYGRAHEGGAYAIYDPAGGSIYAGGTILVQGTDVTWSDLVVYAPDETCVKAPEGYELAGWSIYEDSNQVDYAPGAPILLQKNSVTYLYARWTAVVQAADGLTVSRQPGSTTIQVSASEKWCEESGAKTVICALYNSDGKMLTCGTATLTDGALQLDVTYDGTDADYCMIFGLDGSYAPTCAAVRCKVP